MSKSLEISIESIEQAISKQADRVESMVRVAYRGLCERCLGTADEVLSMEMKINLSEVQIEEQCLELLALYQPVATDLRRVAAVIKINADLERVADLALNLAERTESLAEYPSISVPTALTDMVTVAMEMLRDAKTAFINNDVELAGQVCRRDDELDEMNRHLIAQLSTKMEAEPDQVSGYLHIFSATRTVERIGDHATNIAEDVEFIVDGQITRHRGQ